MTSPQAALAAILRGSPIGRAAAAQVGAGGGAGGPAPAGPPPATRARILTELADHLNGLWTASNPFVHDRRPGALKLPSTPGGSVSGDDTQKNERGCWILYNPVTGALTASDFTAPSTRDGCTPGLRPPQAIVFFHTHPNSVNEAYNSGPSSADVQFANAQNLPGLVRAKTGGYVWFGPLAGLP